MINFKKKQIKNNNSFLGLMKAFKKNNTPLNSTEITITYTLSPLQFIKLYIPLLSLIYIFELSCFCFCYSLKWITTTNLKNIYYYSNFNKKNKHINVSFNWTFFFSYNLNNIIIFSKPKKQLFLLFFKNKPIFIFTGGLMRMVMNEKRKSSKKLYKVAVSIIKLTSILLAKKNYFPSCYLRLNNLGRLKTKIISTLLKTNTFVKIHYVIIKFKLNFSSQKFNTRRSVKKYIKKRFKLN